MRKLPQMAVLLLAVAVVVGLAATWRSLSERRPAPAADYVLLDGRTADLESLKGRVVLLNFWATSCPTCIKEMPSLVAVHEKYRSRGYETLAVAMSYDPPAYVVNFVESRKLPFLVAIDTSGEMALRFGNVQLTPTTFLIDKRGRIVKRYVGEPDFAALNALIEALLAEK